MTITKIVGIGFANGVPWTVTTTGDNGYDIDVDGCRITASTNGFGRYVVDGIVSFADIPEEVWFAEGYAPADGYDLPRRTIDIDTLRRVQDAVDSAE